MKPTIRLLFLISIIAPSITMAEQVRGLDWGASPKEVVKKEGKDPLDKDENIYMYEDKLDGKSFYVAYLFNDSNLHSIRYLLKDDFSNKNQYLIAYKSLKELLEKKYSSPKKDETLWLNDLYKDDPSGWGTAVSVGHLAQYAKWENGDTDIGLMLRGNNFNITLIIEFSNKALAQKASEAKEAEDLSKL